jgi:release factor glutamine methyltransferase
VTKEVQRLRRRGGGKATANIVAPVTDPAQGATSPLPYRSNLSRQELDQIRSWHERAYIQGRAEAMSAQSFEYLGLSLVVPPEVMPIAGVSHVFGNAILAEVHAGDIVLDMGTGSGVNAILAAKRGARVVAVDINPHALEAARDNARRNNVAGLVEVRYSDVFSAVEEQFDLIIFDPPYRWFAPRDLFEAAMTDENYGAMRRFFHEARGHLAKAGRMLISFGTSGDIDYLKRLMSAEGFEARVVSSTELVRDDHKVEYFAFLVR